MGWCEFHEQRMWAKDYCLKKDDFIGSDISKEYCRYDGKGCPIKEGSSSGGCYLTTACVEMRNLPDDCEELTLLRKFRDEWIALQPGGKEEVREYYKKAPIIVETIDRSEDRCEVYDEIYKSVITPCVEDIKAGRNEQAHERYRSMVRDFEEKYLK